jgi:hypothetical protein
VQTDPQLVIDEQAASVPVDARDRAVWAASQQVFVSSLITDMPEERRAVRDAIERCGANPVMFEDLGPQDITAEQAYMGGVRRSNVYVGMFGPRYGVRMANGFSATEAEYREAERLGLRLCLFEKGYDSGHMDGSQRDLLSGIRQVYTTSTWTDPEDLGRRVERRLTDMASEELAPWVRLGRLVFRAREIRADARTIQVTAEVRSRQIHSELMALRERMANDVNFASPHDARRVQVTEVSTTSRSAAGHEETIILVDRGRNQQTMRMRVNQYSADDLTRLALADGLFGTNTYPSELWGRVAVDPLAPLRGRSLDEQVVRPVAQLLVTEHLLSSGAASTVDEFRLGPSRASSRRLRVTWRPPAEYANMPDPDAITIEGEVAGI